MNAAKIREGFEYAINDTPRKGIKEERLHTIRAFRARVVEKGISRWAPNAKDSWGDPDGNYKDDGIRVAYVDRYSGIDTGTGEVLKSRDFLMLWSEYQERRDADDAEAQRRQAAREELRVLTQEKVQASLTRLRDIEGLEQDTDFWPSGSEDHYDGFRFTVNGMTKVLDHIAIEVYKRLSEQE